MPNLPTRNNNPGDLRDTSTGDFRQFSSPQEGYAALLNDLQAKQVGTTTTGLGPSSSLADFAKIYAPPGDNNNSGKYAADLANKMNVSPATQLKDLNLGHWADAIAGNEGFANAVPGYAPPVQASPPEINSVNPPTNAGSGQNFGERTAEQYQQAGNKIVQSVTQGADRLNAAHGLFGKVGALLETGLGTASGAVQGLAAPLTATLGELADKTGIHPLQALSQGPIGQAVSSVAQAHPRLAQDIGDALNVGGAVLGAEAIPKVNAGSLGDLFKQTGKGSTSGIEETVSPKMTPKVATEAFGRGQGTKSGILGRISIQPSPATIRIADAIREHVPDFNPRATLVENIATTKQAVSNLAQDLEQKVVESGQNRIYPFRELEAQMNAADEPISLKGTPFEKQVGPIKAAALQIAKQEGGTIADLFNARKAFDELVDRTYPNLYTQENAPMRAAIKSIRDAMTNFTEAHLPADVGLRASYRAQSNLIRAIENMAEKAASGPEKELGGNAIQRFRSNHPLVSKGIEVGLTGLGAGEAIKHSPF